MAIGRVAPLCRRVSMAFEVTCPSGKVGVVDRRWLSHFGRPTPKIYGRRRPCRSTFGRGAWKVVVVNTCDARRLQNTLLEDKICHPPGSFRDLWICCWLPHRLYATQGTLISLKAGSFGITLGHDCVLQLSTRAYTHSHWLLCCMRNHSPEHG
jgi:hypothetical protein